MQFTNTRFATVSKSLFLGLALLMATSAFAGTKASVELHYKTNVNGTTLKPGEYKLEWEGTGPNVEVSILNGRNVVAKVPAHLVDLASPAGNTAAVVKHNDDGTTELEGVRFEGKKYGLEIGDSGNGMAASK
jgi:hypothetical protein